MSAKNAALELISSSFSSSSSANLSPTEHLLLTHFINEAVDPELAASYLMARVKLNYNNYNYNNQQGIETSLDDFKKDWRALVSRMTICDPVPRHLSSLVHLRDGPRCAMTKGSASSGSVAPAEPAYVVPASLFQDLETAEEGRLFMMLEAFLSPSSVAHLRAQIANETGVDKVTPLRNIWLLSPSIHRAFRNGHVALRVRGSGFNPSGKVESNQEFAGEIQNAWCLLETSLPGEVSGLFLGDGTPLRGLVGFKFSTPDPQTLPTPSIFLFEVHRRFAAALHLFSIEDTIARGWPQQPRDPLGFDVPILRQVFSSIWLHVPSWLRLRCYLLLRRFGAWFYGRGIEQFVQRLPFGLVLKTCSRYTAAGSSQNEPNALRLVERYAPSIPAPRVVDAVVGEDNGTTYLLMTRLPGQMLNEVLHLMSYPERDRFADDLGFYVAQLRQIPHITNTNTNKNQKKGSNNIDCSNAGSEVLFCNTLGGPVIDHRIPDDGSAGPFRSESDFNAHLTSHLGCSLADVVGEENIRYDHRSCFTHSDLHYTNLLVDRGRLSGIVDWECAGFLPEYWEFTKAMYGTRQHPVLEAIVRRAFSAVVGLQCYEAELEVERKLWACTPFGV